MTRHVQYGCGFTAPDGWINYDASPTLRFERFPLLGKFYTRNEQRFPANVKYGDIVAGLPEEPNSCDIIYCAHILEHLSYTDFVKALRNTYTILKPGGTFRGVVPDLHAAIMDYMENKDKFESPASEFMNSTMLGIIDRETGVSGVFKTLFGNSKHLWMWDYKSLHYELQKAGFKNIRPCTFGDYNHEAIALVEDVTRFYNAAAFECVK